MFYYYFTNVFLFQYITLKPTKTLEKEILEKEKKKKTEGKKKATTASYLDSDKSLL